MDSDADKTRMIRRARPEQQQSGDAPADQGAPQDPDATRIIKPTGTPPVLPSGQDDDDATRLLNQPGQPASVGGVDDDSDKTQLVRRSSAGKSAPEEESSASAGPGTSTDDPVTGWLVVVSGPGKGNQVAVGEQDNHIGRSDARVAIDFGDRGISRSNAFVLRYDPKKRRFKILPGEGTNIVYLNDDDLDGPTDLKAGDVIEVSETKLRFVPFCGEAFDWADTDGA